MPTLSLPPTKLLRGLFLGLVLLTVAVPSAHADDPTMPTPGYPYAKIIDQPVVFRWYTTDLHGPEYLVAVRMDKPVVQLSVDIDHYSADGLDVAKLLKRSKRRYCYAMTASPVGTEHHNGWISWKFPGSDLIDQLVGQKVTVVIGDGGNFPKHIWAGPTTSYEVRLRSARGPRKNFQGKDALSNPRAQKALKTIGCQGRQTQVFP